MKSLVGLLLALGFLGTNAHAGMNINEGNWEVAGSGSLSYYSYVGSSDNTYLYLSPQAQYFFMDQFSAGINLSYSRLGGSNFLSMSPEFTKYFSVQEKLAPYVSVAPIGLSSGKSSSPYFFSFVNIGVKYFLTDSVAFGPALQYRRGWGINNYTGSNSVELMGMFSIHL